MNCGFTLSLISSFVYLLPLSFPIPNSLSLSPNSNLISFVRFLNPPSLPSQSYSVNLSSPLHQSINSYPVTVPLHYITLVSKLEFFVRTTMVETRTGPKGHAGEMDPMQKMMMMMMETQRMMLASMEAREQREEVREAKFVAVLDKISSKLDRLEVTKSIPSAAVEDTHNTVIDLGPNASMGIEIQNPQTLSPVSDRGKTHINSNPAPQASTHQFNTSQIVSPCEPTPQFSPKSQYPPLLINPHKLQQTPHQASSFQLLPVTPPHYPLYTPPYNPNEPPPQQRKHI
ncbi:hypothetical protein Dimus_037965 [Dionaea muscipula]